MHVYFQWLPTLMILTVDPLTRVGLPTLESSQYLFYREKLGLSKDCQIKYSVSCLDAQLLLVAKSGNKDPTFRSTVMVRCKHLLYIMTTRYEPDINFHLSHKTYRVHCLSKI